MSFFATNGAGPFYSERSDVIGSTRAARRAGSRFANSAAATSTRDRAGEDQHVGRLARRTAGSRAAVRRPGTRRRRRRCRRRRRQGSRAARRARCRRGGRRARRGCRSRACAASPDTTTRRRCRRARAPAPSSANTASIHEYVVRTASVRCSACSIVRTLNSGSSGIELAGSPQRRCGQRLRIAVGLERRSPWCCGALRRSGKYDARTHRPLQAVVLHVLHEADDSCGSPLGVVAGRCESGARPDSPRQGKTCARRSR